MKAVILLVLTMFSCGCEKEKTDNKQQQNPGKKTLNKDDSFALKTGEFKKSYKKAMEELIDLKESKIKRIEESINKFKKMLEDSGASEKLKDLYLKTIKKLEKTKDLILQNFNDKMKIYQKKLEKTKAPPVSTM
ncbi:MAG: hypothetical protein JXR95_04000 [Deltaproteobacteria bacterium]|nr:hypothetical protein [Deltaproteobacteria bacterium]